MPSRGVIWSVSMAVFMSGERTYHEENAVVVGDGPGGPLRSFSRAIPGALRGQGRELLSCSSSAADSAPRTSPEALYPVKFLVIPT